MIILLIFSKANKNHHETQKICSISQVLLCILYNKVQFISLCILIIILYKLFTVYKTEKIADFRQPETDNLL